MTTAERTQSLIESLTPELVETFLRGEGWAEQRLRSGLGSVWTPAESGQVGEVLVPRDTSIPDWQVRVRQAVRDLSEALNSAVADVALRVSAAASDVVRFHAPADGRGQTVSLGAGAEFLAGAEAVMLAAACSTAERKAYWPTRKPAPATAYLETLRLGHTETGSYVFAIQSPIPPVDVDAGSLDLGVERAQPFARRVVENLLVGVTEAKVLVGEWESGRDASVFDSGVEKGLSANLCDALLRLTKRAGVPTVKIVAGWSRLLPTTAVPSSVEIGTEQASGLLAASEHLKEGIDEDGVTISGYVVRLSSQDPLSAGTVTLEARFEGATRNVFVDLGAARYQEAINAHRTETVFSVRGHLVQEKGRLHLYPAS